MIIDTNKTVIYGQGPNFVLMYQNGQVYREMDMSSNRFDCRVHFQDGTVVRFSYKKPHLNDTWLCTVEVSGTAPWKITRCDDPDSSIKSDVFEISAKIFCTKRTEKLSMKKKEDICKYGETTSCQG